MLRSVQLSRIDWNMVGAAILLAIIGCVLVYSATYFGRDAHLANRQIIWVIIGIVLMAIFMLVDYRLLFDFSWILYAIGIIFLVYLIVRPGTANFRWIQIGAFHFQPAEFMKVFTALVLAKYFDGTEKVYLNWRSVGMTLGILGLPVALIALQPDFGTAITFVPLLAAAMFLGGIKLRYWVMATVAFLVTLPALWLFFLRPYQKQRILTFMDPERDPLGAGYQLMQAKIAIGSGGIGGKGFLQGTQASLEFLPARHTDFIFAVLGEEWGFVGVAVVLALFLFLILRALHIARDARDRGGMFLAINLISFFIFHIVINVGMQIGLLPITGVPLPLVSYGGSQTMVFFMALGLILNVHYRRIGSVE
jgi:rod shape determining protein RodA